MPLPMADRKAPVKAATASVGDLQLGGDDVSASGFERDHADELDPAIERPDQLAEPAGCAPVPPDAGDLSSAGEEEDPFGA